MKPALCFWGPWMERVEAKRHMMMNGKMRTNEPRATTTMWIAVNDESKKETGGERKEINENTPNKWLQIIHLTETYQKAHVDVKMLSLLKCTEMFWKFMKTIICFYDGCFQHIWNFKVILLYLSWLVDFHFMPLYTSTPLQFKGTVNIVRLIPLYLTVLVTFQIRFYMENNIFKYNTILY